MTWLFYFCKLNTFVPMESSCLCQRMLLTSRSRGFSVVFCLFLVWFGFEFLIGVLLFWWFVLFLLWHCYTMIWLVSVFTVQFIFAIYRILFNKIVQLTYGVKVTNIKVTVLGEKTEIEFHKSLIKFPPITEHLALPCLCFYWKTWSDCTLLKY